MTFKTKHCSYDNCRFIPGLYENGNLALCVFDEEGLVFTCTVNPGFRLPDTAIAVKDYSENEGMVDALTEQGIIGRELRRVPSGFVTIPVHELTAKGRELFAEAAKHKDEDGE